MKRVFVRAVLCLSLAATSAVLSCSEAPAGDDAAPSTQRAAVAGDRVDWPAELRFGIIPVEGGADVVDRFQPLVDHLSRQLGVPVIAKTASSYNGMIVAMANKQIDLAYFGPKSYVEAARRADAEAVAMELSENGEPGYYSIIIARADAGMKSLDDARGKRFAFVDANSTSGCLMPRVLLQRDRGERPADIFATPIKFSGSHGNSIVQVRNGHLDVAATNTLDLQRAVASGVAGANDFIELWRSDMIPGCPMTVRRDLPQSLKDAYAAALVGFKGNKTALEQMAIQGYAPASDSDYDVIRYLMRKEREIRREEGDGA